LQRDLSYAGYDNSGLQTGVHQIPITTVNPFASSPVLTNIDLAKINVRYQPWGTNPPAETGISQATYDENPYNLAFKDSLVKRSDNWDFPAYKFPTVGWLGRVHRGTPWQTVYLKTSDILHERNNFGNVGTNTWAIWTGNFVNPVDAANSAPIQDRLLFDLFSTAVNDNATRGQLSVNVGTPNGSSFAAWSALFSGVVTLTNTTAFPQYKPLTNLPVIIQPAGFAWTNSSLGQLVIGINNARAAFTNADGLVGAFEHAGDILAAPQLTESSSFLNTNSLFINGKVIPGSQQLLYGISDELYEWLPQQTMSLLRVSSVPRYVIYCYGQTLKPAPNGIVTGGGSGVFGMVTNYQVVAETATRAVVQFHPSVTTDASGTHTNYNATVEQFNPLPPD
jgi:hypothetical protein